MHTSFSIQLAQRERQDATKVAIITIPKLRRFFLTKANWCKQIQNGTMLCVKMGKQGIMKTRRGYW